MNNFVSLFNNFKIKSKENKIKKEGWDIFDKCTELFKPYNFL